MLERKFGGRVEGLSKYLQEEKTRLGLVSEPISPEGWEDGPYLPSLMGALIFGVTSPEWEDGPPIPHSGPRREQLSLSGPVSTLFESHGARQDRRLLCLNEREGKSEVFSLRD